MALRASDVGTREAPTALAAPGTATPTAATTPASLTLATVHELRPASRVVTIAAQRRERRRWFVALVVFVGAPLGACLGVLGAVR